MNQRKAITYFTGANQPGPDEDRINPR